MGMKPILSLFVLCLLFSIMGSAQPKPLPTPTPFYSEANRKEAERLWKLAIVAKGGREKLRSIQSMVDISDSIAALSLFKTFKIHRVDIALFPWKSWSWNDSRDSVFGIQERMFNNEIGKKYILDPRGKSEFKGLADFEGPEIELFKGKKMTTYVIHLLILNWFEPKVLGMTPEKRGDLIHTEVDGSAIDFLLDRKTHLPLSWKKTLPDGRSWGEWQKDYKDFEGIMMPTHTGPLTESGKETHSYEFNAQIDDAIWERPPALSLGADGWRKRK
jgi:hypothetical protein